LIISAPMAFGAHAGIDEDLGDGVLGGGRFLALVRGRHLIDEVRGVVVGNELKCVRNALYQVFLLDRRHDRSSGEHPPSGHCTPAGGEPTVGLWSNAIRSGRPAPSSPTRARSVAQLGQRAEAAPDRPKSRVRIILRAIGHAAMAFGVPHFRFSLR
jgi:hypothetical protein